jgi:hypothetical protein
MSQTKTNQISARPVRPARMALALYLTWQRDC